MNGQVKFFDRRKGWGFINGEDGHEYYVHFTNINMEGYKYLEEAQQVTFETKETPKGIEAVEVTPH